MRMTLEQCRDRLTTARVARLGTVSAAGEPHLVPVTFAVIDAGAAGDPSAGGGADDFPGYSDRRRTPERRRNPFHRTVEVASEYSGGWLCFEGEGEKRRLAPVPKGWYEAGPDRLTTWLQNAKRVVKYVP